MLENEFPEEGADLASREMALLKERHAITMDFVREHPAAAVSYDEVAYLFGDNWLSQTLYKILALAMLFVGCLAAYTFVWDLGDIGVGLMTIFNLIALFPLAPKALSQLKEYEAIRKEEKKASA